MTLEMVKVELEIPSNTVIALLKIAQHFAMDSNKLAVWFLEWQLAVETDSDFANLMDEKVDDFLMENCWDNETRQHLKTEIKDILRDTP